MSRMSRPIVPEELTAALFEGQERWEATHWVHVLSPHSTQDEWRFASPPEGIPTLVVRLSGPREFCATYDDPVIGVIRPPGMGWTFIRSEGGSSFWFRPRRWRSTPFKKPPPALGRRSTRESPAAHRVAAGAAGKVGHHPRIPLD
jgi:hypothetical protein